MKRLAPYAFGIVGISIGFIIGYAWVLRMHTFVTWHQWSNDSSTRANLIVATLRSIQSGDTNKAIERLESELDREIISLRDVYKSCPRPQDASASHNALERAKDYRITFTHKSNFESVNKGIAEAFDLVTQTNIP